MSDLETLLRTARDAEVSRDAAEAYVRELARWAPAERARRAWLPWAFAVVAATALALVVIRRPAATPIASTPISIGERVAIIAGPDTVYRVIAATSDDTRIAVDRGMVTARLFHGAAHRLSLEGGGVTAVATGTVYTLAVAEHGAVVGVVQGTVEVRDSAGSRAVAGGATWPPSAAFPDRSAAGALLALSDRPAPPLPARVANAPPADAPAPDAVPAPLHPGTPAPSIKDRWHHARLLRGQGQFSEAIAECMAIAETRDATWAPIALLEAARIYLGPLSDPEHAIEIADRLGSQWPNDALAPEARDLRCRALGQLGRASECEARH